MFTSKQEQERVVRELEHATEALKSAFGELRAIENAPDPVARLRPFLVRARGVVPERRLLATIGAFGKLERGEDRTPCAVDDLLWLAALCIVAAEDIAATLVKSGNL